jgi:hypothetical protein
MKNVNQLISQAIKSGFESYGNFRTEDDSVQRETLTCTKGKFSGEVIDIDYNYQSGEILKTTVSSQFPVSHPHYSAPSFKF